MRSVLAWLFMVLVIAVPATTLSQDCTTYGDKEFWIPDPVYNPDYYPVESQVWGDDLILLDGSGAYVLEFPSLYNPVLRASVPGVFNNMSLSGNLIALARENYVDLYTLPDLDHIKTILDFGVLKVSIEDTLMAVAGLDEVRIYSIAHPDRPVLLGATDLDFGFEASFLPFVLIHNGMVMVSGALIHSINLYFKGNLAVIDITDPTQPAVSDYFSLLPDYADFEACIFSKVTVHEPGFLAVGFTTNRSTDLPSYKFLGRFTLDQNMTIDWRDQVVEEMESTRWDYGGGDFVLNDGLALYSIIHWDLSSEFGNYVRNYIIDVSWDNAQLVKDKIDIPVAGSSLSWLPTQGILTCKNRLYRLDPWQQFAPSQSTKPMVSGGRSTTILDPQLGASWSWSSSSYYSQWGIATFDLTKTPIEHLDSVSWEWTSNSGNLIHTGRRIYLPVDGYSYADIAPDGTIGDFYPCPLSRVISALEWDDYFLLSHADRTVGVYSQDQDNDLTLMASLAMPSSGDLFRVKDTAYLQYNTRTQLIAMNDPLHPVDLGYIVIHGKAKCLVGDRLYTLDGSTLYLYNVANPRSPIFRGEHDYRSPIADVFVSDNLIYLSFGELGLSLQDFSPPQAPCTIGGDLHVQAFDLLFNGGRLLTEHFDIVPMECTDPLPVMIRDFAARPTELGVEIRWESATDGLNDQVFRVVRRVGASHTTLDEQPALAGSYRVLDAQPLREESVIYALQLCDPAGVCTELASAPVQPAVFTDVDYQLTAYPNPANPLTTIGFSLPTADHVTLGIFAVDGRRVRTIIDTDQSAGRHEITWDGTDAAGRPAPSGHYFMRLETGKRIVTGRVVVIR